MNIKSLAFAAAAASLVAAPIVAQAADGSLERSSAPVSQKSGMGKVSTPFLLLLVAAVGAGIYFAFIDDNNDPISA